MSNKAKVTVVIPNYNGLKFMDPCFKALNLQLCRDFDILVVDNGSTDGSVEWLKEHEIPSIFLEKNTGFSGAVNVGIKASKTPYVILLNNDTEPDCHYIGEMIKAIERSPEIFSVSSKMIQLYDHSKMDDAGDMYTLLGWAFQRGVGRPATGYNRSCSVFSACAGAAIYRREVFETIGYFDEMHFAYLGSGTSGSRYNSFKVRLAARNNIYLNYKNMPWPQLLLNALPLGLGILVKYGFFKKIGFGKDYLDGLKEGVKTAKLCKKVKYNRDHLKHYAAIEWELCTGTLLYIREFLARQAAKR